MVNKGKKEVCVGKWRYGAEEKGFVTVERNNERVEKSKDLKEKQKPS